MEIIINGQSREVPEKQTVRALLVELGLESARVAVEVDGRIVKPGQWAQTVLAAGARVEIVHFVGGG
jgi:thiamine biosynthesis protein ThiS